MIAVVRSACLVLIVLTFTNCSKREKIAYVDTQKLYEHFELQKRKNSEFNKWYSSRANGLDSLEKLVLAKVEQANNTREVADIEVASLYKQQLDRDKVKFEDESQKKIAGYNEEVWSQLNQYIEDYASKHEYDIILGANGMGSLMYARNDLDLTDSLINVCNNRFLGGAQ